MGQDAVQAEMARWHAWMSGLGPALLDPGAPFGASGSVVDDGSTGSAAGLTGYTIVQADDLAAARSLTDGHPFLAEGKGDYAIDLFELMAMPGS